MTLPPVHILADDRTGFPMVGIPGIPFHIGWWPLAWIQLEYFLGETSDRRFDLAWYQDMVKRLGRGSAGMVSTSNFPSLFVRGLTLQEARLIGRWWGEDRNVVPTSQEWQHIQDAALAIPVIPNAFEGYNAQVFNPRAIRLIQSVERVTSGKQPDLPKTLADQMLMRNGLRELVLLEAASTAVGGIGTPHRAVESFSSKLILPLDEGNRARRSEVGLRLFLKA